MSVLSSLFLKIKIKIIYAYTYVHTYTFCSIEGLIQGIPWAGHVLYLAFYCFFSKTIIDL